MPNRNEQESMEALLRRSAQHQNQPTANNDDNNNNNNNSNNNNNYEPPLLNEWCQSLQNQGITSTSDLHRLTDDAVSHMSIDASLKSLIQTYRRNYKSSNDAFSPAEKEKVMDNVEYLTNGFIQWYAVVGIISALIVSITVEPLVGLDEDVDSWPTQLYAVLLTLSFAAGVGSIMTLCHVVGMLTGTLIQDRLWFFATFYETDAMLPNILMIVSVFSLAGAIVVRTVQQLGNVVATYVICTLYGVFVVGLVWWVLWRFPRKYTREGIHGFLQHHGPFAEMEREARQGGVATDDGEQSINSDEDDEAFSVNS